MDSIAIILFFQNLGDWLIAPMQFLSFLGTEDFYFLILPIIYWGFDAGLGLRLGIMIALTSGINSIFKLIFHSPRPYWVNTDVRALSAETSFGAPSGHAQNALALWGVLGSYVRKAWVWALVIFLVVGISLSRLFLAVHFPIDTILGWVIGIILLIAFNQLWEPIGTWAQTKSLKSQISAAFLAAILLLFTGIIAKAMLANWAIPIQWETNAIKATEHAIDPLSLDGLITSSATLFGLLAGLAWITTQGGYKVASKIKNRIAQYIVGVIGVALLYIGLKVIFPTGDHFISYLFRFIRYTLVGFWVSGLAPFIFIKLKITS